MLDATFPLLVTHSGSFHCDEVFAYAVLRAGGDPDGVRDWLNARVGKTQRVAQVVALDEMPRSAIGKVLKRDLRDRWLADGGVAA